MPQLRAAAAATAAAAVVALALLGAAATPAAAADAPAPQPAFPLAAGSGVPGLPGLHYTPDGKLDESCLPLIFKTPRYLEKLAGLTPAERTTEIIRIFKKRRAKGIIDEVPYERLADKDVRTLGGCSFHGCPAGHPFVYYLTSHRNRAASYNRLLRSLAMDLASSVNRHPPQCVCAAAGDYNDVVVGPTVWEAMEDWPYNKAVIQLKGPFSRAGGFQRCMDHLVTTPRNESLVFLLDADLVAFPGLLNRIINYTRVDRWAFAPAVWSTSNTPNDSYAGYWRSGGTGMMAFFVSELDKFGGTLPLVSKVSWGGEDHYLTKYLQKKAMVKIKRTCTPELWHFWHPKASWGGAADGRHHTATGADAPPLSAESVAWKLPITHHDGMQVLQQRGELDVYRCRMLAAGSLYPPEVAPGAKLGRKRGPI